MGNIAISKLLMSEHGLKIHRTSIPNIIKNIDLKKNETGKGEHHNVQITFQFNFIPNVWDVSVCGVIPTNDSCNSLYYSD